MKRVPLVWSLRAKHTLPAVLFATKVIVTKGGYTMKCNIKTAVPGQQWLDWVEVDIEVGDDVRLTWYGDANIPYRLNATWAVVERITQKQYLIVRCHEDAYGTRSIQAERHVSKLDKKVVDVK
jgi:hypothetical protein